MPSLKPYFLINSLYLLSILSLSLSANAEPPATTVGGVPEAPILLRPVHEVDIERNADGSIKKESPQYYRTIRPAIPPVRTTHDGRIGYNWTNRRLYLLAPERITKPFTLSEPGMPIVADLNGVHSQVENFLLKPSDYSVPSYIEGPTLCSPVAAENQPRRCNGSNDCYDVSYIGFRVVKSAGNAKNSFDHAFLRSRKVEIEVANPKSLNPTIVNIRPLGEISEKSEPIEVDSTLIDGNFVSFEPMTVADGHLYVARAGFNPIKHIDSLGNSGAKNVDIYYMVSPASAPPCEASAFSYIKRIQKAYKDPEMRDPVTGQTRYGIAEYPMRDSTGKLIPEEGLFPLYPWMDRHGNNLFFATRGSNLFSYDYSSQDNYREVPVGDPALRGSVREWKMNSNSERYPARCIQGVPNCKESPYNPEMPDSVRGFSVLGSWTHGKLVTLDGMINSSDYGLRRGLQAQRELQLYQASGSFDGWVRVGPGRDTGGGGSGIDNNLETFAENSEIRGMSVLTGVIDSLENRFNAFPFLRPTLPRDIVWIMNNSIGSDEIAFDDYMDSKALIISTMIGSVEYVDYSDRNGGWRYRDGFGWPGSFTAPEKQNGPVLIQNAATSNSLPVPAWGYLNKGRVEPVALGGVHGRGLWLEGSTLSYTFPKAITKQSLFFSFFIDHRPLNTSPKKIATFPDGTGVLIVKNGLRITKTIGNSTITKDVPEVVPTKQWTHLGLAVSSDGKQVNLYINGMKKYSLTFKQKVFQLVSQSGKEPYNLVVGANSPAKDRGLRAWIDEVKLFTYIPVPEVICNHAYGSLHYVKPEAGDYWRNLANGYPASTHDEIRNALPESYIQESGISNAGRFVCTVDYNEPMGIYRALQRESENLISLREALLFAVPKGSGAGYDDGRLFWNAQRMDFQKNQFCLSCHTTEERRGLQMAALAAIGVCEMQDPRRQPLQALPFLSGQLTETQLMLISPNHQNQKKIYHPNGALRSDPLILRTKPGGSCQ